MANQSSQLRPMYSETNLSSSFSFYRPSLVGLLAVQDGELMAPFERFIIAMPTCLLNTKLL